MHIDFCQRWRDRRGTYRPRGETIRPHEFEVAEIKQDKQARAFVVQHHYAGSYPAARRRYGLYRREELVGVAVLSQPASQAALEAALPMPGAQRAELGRFVLLDSVAANGESWFLARVWALARRDGFEALVAHADPESRRSSRGVQVFGGHLGTIYQATGGRYCGRTPRRTWHLLPDGSVLSARALSKLRTQERGYRYVVEQLEQHGAPAPSGTWRTWVRSAVQSTTRTFRHPGTHRYAWALDQRLERHLPAALAYPKFHAAQLGLSFGEELAR